MGDGFEVKVRAIEELVPHPNADNLDVARSGGYQFLVWRGRFKVGDLGLYIPKGAIVPDYIIEDMEIQGKLAGAKKNRVGFTRLRGIVSQGLFWRPDNFNLNERLRGKILALPAPPGANRILLTWLDTEVGDMLGITNGTSSNIRP